MVSEALGCPALLGKEATADRVLEILRGKVFDVIHFACHFVSAGSPEMPGLLMADGATIAASQIAESGVSAQHGLHRLVLVRAGSLFTEPRSRRLQRRYCLAAQCDHLVDCTAARQGGPFLLQGLLSEIS